MTTFLQISSRVLVGLHALAAGATLYLFLAFGAGFVEDRDGYLLLAVYAVVGAAFLGLCLVAMLVQRADVQQALSLLVAIAVLVGARQIGGPGGELPSDLPELVPTFLLVLTSVVGLAVHRRTQVDLSTSVRTH